MVSVVCPDCGAALRGEGPWVEENSERCTQLVGTPFADSANVASGISWCPTLAAAAEARGIVLQGTTHKDEVLAAIRKAIGL